MVSIKDIAKAIGVSASTVSVVLNGKAKTKRISDQLATRIMEASKHMGYSPNQVAVSLRTGRSKTIGLIVEDIANQFFSSLARTIEDRVRRFGYNVVYCSTENDVDKGADLIRMLYNNQVEGYIITPSPGMTPYVERLMLRNKAIVLIDRHMNDVNLPCVTVDNYAGMKAGTELLTKAGYKKIGFVTNTIALSQMHDRERGFTDAIQEASLPLTEAHFLRIAFSCQPADAVKAISNFVGAEPHFDAVVFATNYLGIYGLQSLRSLQITIRKDMGVLCFDDHDLFNLHSPSITVVSQPMQDMGAAAVNILMAQLQKTQTHTEQKVVLPAKLIIRDSI